MPLLSLAVMTMTVAQLLDLSTFVTMIHRLGPAAEANPLVAGLLSDYGVPMAAIAKVALIAFVVAITAVLAGRERRFDRVLGAAVLGVAILAGIVGGGTNVLTMGPL
jgi:hypothetical protein